MNQEISKEQYTNFFELEYSERLRYWDVNQLDFTSQSFGKDDKQFLNIKPYNLETIIAYDKWIINHWRAKLFSQTYDVNGEYGNDIIYKNVDVYISGYDRTIETKNIHEIRLYIADRINMCDEFVIKTKARNSFVNLVYKKIRDNNEDEIYTFTEQVDVLLALKQFAKVWDIIVYKIFLERKLGALGNKGKLFERTKVKMNKLNPNKIGFLYDELVKGRYIDNEGGYINFKQIMLMDGSINLVKINWIYLRGGDEISKVPLIILAKYIVNEDAFGQNTFIIDNFVTYTKKNKEEITRKELNQCRKRIPKQNIDNQPVVKIISQMIGK